MDPSCRYDRLTTQCLFGVASCLTGSVNSSKELGQRTTSLAQLQLVFLFYFNSFDVSILRVHLLRRKNLKSLQLRRIMKRRTRHMPVATRIYQRLTKFAKVVHIITRSDRTWFVFSNSLWCLKLRERAHSRKFTNSFILLSAAATCVPSGLKMLALHIWQTEYITSF